MFTLEMAILQVGGTAGLFGLDAVAIPLLKKGGNRIFGRKAPVPAPVPAKTPAFKPIDREHSIDSEHQVETSDTTTNR